MDGVVLRLVCGQRVPGRAAKAPENGRVVLRRAEAENGHASGAVVIWIVLAGGYQLDVVEFLGYVHVSFGLEIARTLSVASVDVRFRAPVGNASELPGEVFREVQEEVRRPLLVTG